jgi:hypothetical protein
MDYCVGLTGFVCYPGPRLIEVLFVGVGGFLLVEALDCGSCDF